ncbi:MAG TPA: serine--tRNA ligase [Kiritimatiellia bacterium]|nr:serine--tRNA ligase [Kiritimatiellia bacterium]HRZ12482.1 serine--tRNA ligase [Kiritimatiellia bacterium]HSA17760.1 serine--tRNA ligase [Kiritimatiellia bacterium]
MLDIRTIREREADVRRALDLRGVGVDLDAVLALDRDRRSGLAEVEQLKNQRNVISKEIGALKKAGQDTAARQAEVRAMGDRIAELDRIVREAEEKLNNALLFMPNLPHPAVPPGHDAAQNRVVRQHGTPRSFDFEPKPHWELGEKLGLFDLERGARMSGAGFPLFTGRGARLERGLIQFMLDLHTTQHGYREIAPPFLCNAASMTGTGQLPKLAEDMYHVASDDLYLIPTAEVPVTNFYREEIIRDPLPVKLTAYSACFRREAGAAGRDTRGLIRVHQFDKVELVKFVEPETSDAELETLLADAEDVLQRLGLVYRILELCAGDLSFASSHTYDIELWAPAQKAWLEVSSCSNFGDFQARRAGIRYRNKDGKAAFVHTLNGSGVALPRLVVALLENGQRADGSIVLPEALHPYLGGLTVLD